MRVAVVGAKGAAGRRHSDAFHTEGCEVVELDVGTSCSDWSIFDAVSIATPDNLHIEQAIAVLCAGRPVFCEKPLSHSQDELDWLERYGLGRGIAFSCNLPLRHSAKAQKICVLPHWGQYVWGRPAKWGGWRGDIENYSIACGGGIHLVDLMMTKFGTPEIVRSTKTFRKMFAILDFKGRGFFSLWLDFESSGDHKVTMASGRQIVEFDEPNDFRAPIREFLEDIKAGRPGNGLEAIAANRVCLQIEEAAK